MNSKIKHFNGPVDTQATSKQTNEQEPKFVHASANLRNCIDLQLGFVSIRWFLQKYACAFTLAVALNLLGATFISRHLVMRL